MNGARSSVCVGPQLWGHACSRPDCCDPSEATICLQSGLLELSGLSADLDILNELGRSLMLGDVTARRLQHINRGWADASSRAEEACRSVRLRSGR